MAWLRRRLRDLLIVLSIAALVGCQKSESPPESKIVATPPTVPGPWNLPGNSPDRRPHLVAHYMPWFSTNPNWDHWKWTGGGPAHDPTTRPADDRSQRNIASIVYPLIGPYNSASRNVVRYHLRTAQAAGIEAFVCIWYGPGSDTDQRIPLLLEEADAIGFRIAICYEEKINFPPYRKPKTRGDIVKGATDDLAYIAATYGTHPAYLKWNGRPVVFQFNAWGAGALGPNNIVTSEWKKIFAALPSPVAYCRQNLDEAYHPLVDGAFVWWTPQFQQLDGFATRAAAMRESKKLKFFATMICPGFDDTGVWGWGNGPRATNPPSANVLRETFDHALVGDPDLIQIVTWNDFAEGTVVEPTRESGFKYLDAIETWWGQKTGREINLDDNRMPFLAYIKTAAPVERSELPPEPYDSFFAK